jgi:uncharacterized protein (DUF4415 family)
MKKNAKKAKSDEEFLTEDFDFAQGVRGAVINKSGVKFPVSIRLDGEIINFFKDKAEKMGEKAKYQSLINEALREYVTSTTIQDLLLSKEFIRSLGSALVSETKKKKHKKSA